MARIFKTAWLRAALLYVSLFLLSAGVVLGVVYVEVTRNLTTLADDAVWRDAAIVSYVYSTGGRKDLLAYVSRAHTPQVFYRLSDRLGRYMGGNLRDFPAPDATTRNNDDWLEFAADGVRVRARLIRLDEDVILLIGHNMSDHAKLTTQLVQLFVAALVGLAALGILGGGVMARRSLVRVDAINKGLQRIISGDFTARIVPTGSDDEWDALAHQINTMLARIDGLIAAMRQVTDNVAHDLRRPLTHLRARLEQALTKKGDAAQMAEQLEASLADIDTILAVFAALLSLSRMESGVAEGHFEKLDIDALVADLVALYAPVFEEQNMRLCYVPAHDSAQQVVLDANRALLSQALVNLIENVLHHAAKPESKTEVRVQASADDIIIEIADGGDGIPESDLSRITQRFVRLDSSRHTQGYGLGLALSKAIVQLHGGTLDFSAGTTDTTGTGRGLVARIHLPRTRARP